MSAAAVHFTIHPRRAAGVQLAGRRLQQAIRLLQQYLLDDARRAVRDGRAGSWRQPALPAAMARRIAREIAGLTRLGAVDAAAEMAEASAPRLAVARPSFPVDDAAYLARARVLAERLAAEAYERLKALLTAGLAAGQTDREIGATLRSADLGVASTYAQTWASTESTRYYTTGRVAQIEAAGDDVWGYEYVVIEDSRTTDICRPLEGKRVARADMVRYPPLHWRCRTTVMAVMAEDVTGDDPAPAGTVLETQPEPQAGFGERMAPPQRRK